MTRRQGGMARFLQPKGASRTSTPSPAIPEGGAVTWAIWAAWHADREPGGPDGPSPASPQF